MTKSNLRGKRSDPWHWANASPKAVADPAQNGQDAIRSRIRVLTWFASRRPQAPAQASQEASLEIQRPQGAGRPCYEAGNSACRGEWRREAGSTRKGAPNVSVGKRDWRTPSPQFALVQSKDWTGAFCFKNLLALSGILPKSFPTFQ